MALIFLPMSFGKHFLSEIYHKTTYRRLEAKHSKTWLHLRNCESIIIIYVMISIIAGFRQYHTFLYQLSTRTTMSTDASMTGVSIKVILTYDTLFLYSLFFLLVYLSRLQVHVKCSDIRDLSRCLLRSSTLDHSVSYAVIDIIILQP